MEDNMEKIIVKGGKKLQGEVDISVAKNLSIDEILKLIKELNITINDMKI